MNTNGPGNVLTTISDRTKRLAGTTPAFEAVIETAQDYYPFGSLMPGRKFNAGEYRFGYQGSEKDDEITGVTGANITSFFRENDTRLGRWWSIDPKDTAFESPYMSMGVNPVLNNDMLGDTTYRFNKSDGKYIGMFDLDAAGHKGSYGGYKTIGEVENQQIQWDGQYFNFADPVNDSKDIRVGKINQLVFVSNDEIKGMLNDKGAFNHNDKNNLWRFYKNSTGGQNFDYSYTTIPQKYGDQGASSNPLKRPSSVLFLPEGDHTAHNHMNFGNYLWGASGYTLGFNFLTLQTAAHVNSLLNSKKNNYPAQWDSSDDQNSINKGAFHALQNKYRTVLKSKGVTE